MAIYEKTNQIEPDMEDLLNELDGKAQSPQTQPPSEPESTQETPASELYRAVIPRKKEQKKTLMKGTVKKQGRIEGMRHVSPPAYLYFAMSSAGLTEFERHVLDRIYFEFAQDWNDYCLYERIADLKEENGVISHTLEERFRKAIIKLKDKNIVKEIKTTITRGSRKKSVKAFFFNADPTTWTNVPAKLFEIIKPYIEEIRVQNQR